MDAAAFLGTIRRRASTTTPVQDPLAEARRILATRGDTSEGRALRRVMQTLATGAGEFAESDVWWFSGELLALVSALIEVRLAGRYSNEDWEHACRS
jgi:hypothetical protein